MAEEVKRSVSHVLIGGIHQLETGNMSLEETHQLVDLVAKAVPASDQKQADFYEAIKALATKVFNKEHTS